jgi:AI-2 transport protein TqsA
VSQHEGQQSATGAADAGAAPAEGAPLPEPPLDLPRRLRERVTPTTVAAILVIAATSWYLLHELAPLLRPLLLAVFLCYIIVPTHLRLRRYLTTAASIALLAGFTTLLLFLLAGIIYSSIVDLNEELPSLIERGKEIVAAVQQAYQERLPVWLTSSQPADAASQAQTTDRLRQGLALLVNVAAGTLTEAVIVGIYLIFILLEVGRLPDRVEGSFAGARAQQIMEVVQRINEAMANYLRVKLLASLIIAVPVTLVLWAFGVKFPLLWGVLTFLGNFIPYLGSIVACALPCLLAFLEFNTVTVPAVVTAILVALHALTAYVVEPAMTGKAVGLSPLVIVAALSFWGLSWGLPGMFLAVPLTVMFKIVLENVDFTRPFALLMGGDG